MKLATTSQPTQVPSPARTRRAIPASDGRSAVSRFRKRMTAELLQHLGGKASTVQMALIGAIIEIQLELACMQERRNAKGHLSLHDQRAFLAYSNTLRRHLCGLGMNAAPEPKQTLSEYLASKAEAKAA